MMIYCLENVLLACMARIGIVSIISSIWRCIPCRIILMCMDILSIKSITIIPRGLHNPFCIHANKSISHFCPQTYRTKCVDKKNVYCNFQISHFFPQTFLDHVFVDKKKCVYTATFFPQNARCLWGILGDVYGLSSWGFQPQGRWRSWPSKHHLVGGFSPTLLKNWSQIGSFPQVIRGENKQFLKLVMLYNFTSGSLCVCLPGCQWLQWRFS